MSKKNSKQRNQLNEKTDGRVMDEEKEMANDAKEEKQLVEESEKKEQNKLVDHLKRIVARIKQLLKSIWHQKDTIRDVIKNRHRFVVMDSQTYKEKLSFQLTGINLFVVLGISMILLVVLTTLIIAFTPLREFIPGYTNNQLAEQSYENAMVIDSLSEVMAEQERLISDIKAIIMGQDPALLHRDNTVQDTSDAAPREYVHTKADSMLRKEVEAADKYSLRSSPSGAADNQVAVSVTPVSMQLFFTPQKGKVVSTYDSKVGHYGVDIAGASSDVVKSIAGGTVIMSQFTVEDGYVMAIQHGGNIISIYKQVSSVIKKEGNVVRAGEPIAFLGEFGNTKIGPHLHFELWMGGKPVNPLQYISF